MRVHDLHLHGFTKHIDTRVTFPAQGIVAFTGDNGSGKSSVVEGVAVAGWGDTLRGTSPWQDGRDGLVELTTSEVGITRVRSGSGKSTLVWSAPGQVAAKYETVTKSQEALEAIVGPFNVWRRTSVFSSQDAAHFTMATDAERKRLLESILNLSRFDSALDRCKIERKTAEELHAHLSTGLATLKAKLEVERLRVRDAESTVAGLPAALDVSAVKAEHDRLIQTVKQVTDEIGHLTVTQREEDRGVAVAEAGAREAARRLGALDVGNCDKCGQAIPKTLVASLNHSAHEAKLAAIAAKAKADQLRADRTALLEELGVERDAFQRKQFDLQSKLSAEMTNATRRRSAETLLENATAAVTSLEGRIANGETQVAAGASTLAVLHAVELVLGIKGVRAHVLGKTLTGLEAVANSWLGRIAGPGLTLSMKPYSEKKTGGVSDAISLEVAGAGGGFGYKAASGGERRRLDVALLLALAEVAQAAHGRGAGSTLFFDECMDSLDRDGIVAVSAALRDLAKGRCVVVITHDADLLEELRPDQHYIARAGVLKAA